MSELATEKKARLERLSMAAFTGLIGHFGDRMEPTLMAETAVELGKALMNELEKWRPVPDQPAKNVRDMTDEELVDYAQGFGTEAPQ